MLVCDDDPSLRELVRAVLGPRYRFVEAADGNEALSAMRELSPGTSPNGDAPEYGTIAWTDGVGTARLQVVAASGASEKST